MARGRAGARAAVATLASLLALAPPAAAHGGSGAATDYRSTVTRAPAGVAARVVGGDDRILVRRAGAAEVLVLGYEGEPFLRLTADGVFRNDASLAAALADERAPAQTATGDPDAAPRWRRIGGGDTVVYHDHRAHWMADIPPAVVRAAPDTARSLGDWSIPVVVDGAPGTLEGSLRYVPPPPAGRYWGLLVVASAAAAALGARGRGPWPARALAATALVAAGTVEVAAALDAAASLAGPLVALLVPAAIGAGVAWRVRREPAAATTALALATLVGAAFPAGSRVADAFAHGVVPSALPSTAVRCLLVVAIAASIGTLAASAAAWRTALAAATRRG